MTGQALTDPELIDALEGDDIETGKPGADDGDAGGEGAGEPAPKDDDDDEAVKAIAKRFGWKEDFQGDPAKKVSAGQFIDNTRQVIFNQRDKLARLEPLVDRLASETSRLRQGQEAQRAASLDRALEAAVEVGNLDEAKRIMAAARAQPEATADEPPAARDFKTRNASWFGVDPEATAYAESVDRRFAQANGGIKDPEQHAAMVEAAVKKLFPQHFGGEAKPAPKPDDRRPAPVVNRGNRTAGRPGNGDITEGDLTPAERKAAAAFGLTGKEYADQINEDRKKAAAR